jgi:hypothetical protein
MPKNKNVITNNYSRQINSVVHIYTYIVIGIWLFVFLFYLMNEQPLYKSKTGWGSLNWQGKLDS